MSVWKKFKLEELVDTERGISYGIVQPGTFLDKGGVPILKVNNLTEKKTSERDLFRVSEEIEAKFSRTRLQGNEILISLVGSVGHIHKVTQEQVGWNVVRAIGVLPIKKEVNRDWVYWCLRSPDIQALLINSAVTTVQSTLNIKELKEIEISVPETLEEQARIGSILSSLDGKIELNIQMNQTLEAMAQAIFKEWFVNFNFPGFDGQLVDGFPKGWSVGSIGEVISVQNGFAFKSEDFRDEGKHGVLKIRNISNNLVDTVNLQFIDSTLAESIDSRFRVRSQDLLIAMTGAEVGKVGLVPNTTKNLWLNQRVGSFKEKVKFSKWFCYLILSTPEYQNVLLSSASGSAQPNISSTQIERTQTLIPPKDLFEKFGELINPLFERLAENYAQNLTLQEIRDSLLPKLMSGKIEVKA